MWEAGEAWRIESLSDNLAPLAAPRKCILVSFRRSVRRQLTSPNQASPLDEDGVAPFAFVWPVRHEGDFFAPPYDAGSDLLV